VGGIGQVESAASVAAGSLSAMHKFPASADFGTGPDSSSGDTVIIVKIGEDTITEKVISNINRRNRIAGKTVIPV
jgi:hypothetical protein